MQDAFLTAVDNVVMPRVELAVRSITESSVRGPNSVVQKSDQRYFTRKTEKTPLILASSRLDSNIEQEKNDENRNAGNFEDEDFPVLRLNYNRRALAHHNGALSSRALHEVFLRLCLSFSLFYTTFQSIVLKI